MRCEGTTKRKRGPSPSGRGKSDLIAFTKHNSKKRRRRSQHRRRRQFPGIGHLPLELWSLVIFVILRIRSNGYPSDWLNPRTGLPACQNRPASWGRIPVPGSSAMSRPRLRPARPPACHACTGPTATTAMTAPRTVAWKASATTRTSRAAMTETVMSAARPCREKDMADVLIRLCGLCEIQNRAGKVTPSSTTWPVG